MKSAAGVIPYRNYQKENTFSAFCDCAVVSANPSLGTQVLRCVYVVYAGWGVARQADCVVACCSAVRGAWTSQSRVSHRETQCNKEEKPSARKRRNPAQQRVTSYKVCSRERHREEEDDEEEEEEDNCAGAEDEHEDMTTRENNILQLRKGGSTLRSTKVTKRTNLVWLTRFIFQARDRISKAVARFCSSGKEEGYSKTTSQAACSAALACRGLAVVAFLVAPHVQAREVDDRFTWSAGASSCASFAASWSSSSSTSVQVTTHE